MDNDIVEILLEYASDTEQTYTSNNFVRWVYKNRPDVAERVGAELLEDYANRYMWSGEGVPPWMPRGAKASC